MTSAVTTIPPLLHRLPTLVSTFDGWLAMKTDGRLRFNTAEDVRSFIHDGFAEAIVSEYIQTWGAARVVRRPPRPVQPEGR